MKKSISLLLIFILGVLTLAGCGENSTSDTTDSSSGSTSAVNQSEEEETGQGKSEKNDYTLTEMEPYIACLGEIVDGNTINMSTSENENKDNITISGITGKVSLSADSLGEYIKYAGRLKWETSGSYTFEDYEKVREAVINFYDIETENLDSYDSEDYSFSCENKYVTIALDYTPSDERKDEITILWTLKADNFDQGKVSCYIATQILKNALRDPDSLEVHDIGYYPMEYADGSGTVYGVHINYSAKNGFGGYNRDDYYIFIDPATYAEAVAMSSADSLLPDKEFKSVNVEDVGSLRVTVNNSAITNIVDKSTLEPLDSSNVVSDEQLTDDLNFLLNRAHFEGKYIQDISGDVEITREEEASEYYTKYFENAYLFGLSGEIMYYCDSDNNYIEAVEFVPEATYEAAAQMADCLIRALGTNYSHNDYVNNDDQHLAKYTWENMLINDSRYKIMFTFVYDESLTVQVRPIL